MLRTFREVFALKIFKIKRKKQGRWSHFVAEVDVKNKRMFCRNNLLDLFYKKGALKYFAKLTGKHVNGSLFFKEKFQYVDLQLYLKSGSCIGFFCEIYKFLQNCFTPELLDLTLVEYL